MDILDLSNMQGFPDYVKGDRLGAYSLDTHVNRERLRDEWFESKERIGFTKEQEEKEICL